LAKTEARNILKVENLELHPEGGRFREVFRSGRIVQSPEGKNRSALTHIYFEINDGEVSRFHRVCSDEVWNLYEGEGVLLYLWDDDQGTLETVELSAGNREFCHVVKAGVWQAARPLRGRVLSGCSVGPGFEFEDFELIDPQSGVAQRILDADPTLEFLI
jgi:predicted cupin superfamily sugar epimerase